MANFTSSPSVGDEIAKGVNRYRFNGVGWTPVSRSTVAGSLAVTQIKWQFKMTEGQTSITGTDSNGLLLDYDTNAEVEVSYNGIKIVEGSSKDYVLTSSSVLTIVGSGVKLNDEIEIVQRSRFTAADYYEKTELDTSLAGKVDDAQVLTNVPAGALFTDTGTDIGSSYNSVMGTEYLTITSSTGYNNLIPNASETDDFLVGGNPGPMSIPQVVKLSGIEDGAKADQTKADIDALGINASTVNSKTVATNVPAGALFTDTTNLDGLTDAVNDVSSVGLGSYALANDDGTDNKNTAVGTAAMNYNTTGVYNVAVGMMAMRLSTTGHYNTAIGSKALYTNTTGGNNTAVGYWSMNKNTTGHDNTAIGVQAMERNTEGRWNASLGRFSLFYNTTGDNNTAIGGYTALYSNTTGNENTATGSRALKYNTTGIRNTASGKDAMFNNATGSNNVALGYEAGYNETGSNKLHIANNQTESLIEGDFSAKTLTVNGALTATSFSGDGSALTGITDTDTVYTHPSTHPISKISGLQTALDGKTTESYVNAQIGAVVGAATPATLNTLQELGDALGDDANFAGTMTTALAGKVDDAQVLTNVPSGAVFTDTNTTYSVGDGGLTQKNFTTTLKTKLDGIEALAEVNEDAILTSSQSNLFGSRFLTLTVNPGGNSIVIPNASTTESGPMVYTDKVKLDSIESSADVTDTANVVASLTAGTNVAISAGGTISSTYTDTTYSVGDGGLTQKNFTTTLKSKLDGVASSANNYTHPSAHSISEVTNLQTELDDIETLALAGL